MASATLLSALPEQAVSEEELLARRRARFQLPDNFGQSAKTESTASQQDKEPKRRGPKHQNPQQERMKIGFAVLTEEQAALRQARANRFHTEDSLVNGGAQLSRPSSYQGGGRQHQAQAMELSEEDLLAERRITAMTAERRPEAVLLYMTDPLSTTECLQYFTRYETVSVEWVDQHSCNVIFADAASAKDAVLGLGTLLSPEEAPDSLGLIEADVADVTYLWHRGIGAYSSREDKITAPVCFRIATVSDKQTQQPGEQGNPNRQKAAHRGKGKGSKAAQQQKRPRDYQDVDAVDGDVKMQSRGERGGRRYQEKKQRQQMRMNSDTDMLDADEGFGAIQNQPTNSEIRAAAAMGDEASYHKVHGSSALFSAEAAGARGRPSSQLHAPKPTQIRDQILDYGDV